MGYDPTYGARPLKRVIQKRLVDPLALGLLKGEYAAGDAIVVDARRASRRRWGSPARAAAPRGAGAAAVA